MAESLQQAPFARDELLVFARALAEHLSMRHALEEHRGDLCAANTFWDGEMGIEQADEVWSADALEALGALPPECLENEEPIRAADARGEVWQAGVLLYEAATGEHPFPDEDPEDRRHAIRHEHPSLPGSLRPEIPLEWDPIISCCLHKRARERYADALDLAREIEALALSGGSQRRRLPRVIRWRRVVIAVAILAGLIAWLSM